MRTLFVLVVAALAALAVARASPTPPSPVIGTFAVVTATTTSTRTAGGNTFVTHGTGGLSGLHAQGPFSGDFFVANLGGKYHFD